MKERYVWLNTETGKFSNSWTKDSFGYSDSTQQTAIEAAKDTNWKLIKYECINDENFEITKHFKLR